MPTKKRPPNKKAQRAIKTPNKKAQRAIKTPNKKASKPIIAGAPLRSVSDRKKLLEDLHNVLNQRGVDWKIESMTFSGGGECDCGPGCTGVLRVIGGELVCVPI